MLQTAGQDRLSIEHIRIPTDGFSRRSAASGRRFAILKSTLNEVKYLRFRFCTRGQPTPKR
jgi:hypothetical protein